MNYRLLALLLSAAAPAAAQQLPTLFAGGTTVAAGGAVYFNLDCDHPNGITVSSFVLNFADPGGTAGTVDVYVAEPGTPFDATWTPLVTGVSVTSVGPGAPTNVPLGTSSPLQLSDGCSYDVAIVSSLQHLVTPVSATGQLFYGNADLTMENGVYTDAPFDGTPNVDYVVNGVIFYQPGGACPSQASTTNIGQGCVQRFDTVYEWFPVGTLDLTRVTYTGSFASGGSASPTGSQFSQAYQPVNPGTAQQWAVLNLQDDDQATLGSYGFLPPLDAVVVGSNGWVAFGPGNSNAATPNSNTMRNNPSAAYYAWRDLDPTAGGTVWAELRTWFGLPQLRITFDGVPSYSHADSNTIQFVMTFVPSVATPFSVTTHLVNVSSSGTPLIVGLSNGGPSENPGSVDLSTTKPYAAADLLPLQLDAVAPPRQGSAPIPFELVTSNVPASALLHVGVLGFSSGSFALDALDMPTCTLYQSLDRLVGPHLVTGSSVQWTAWTVPPVQPSYAGVEFYVQSFIMGTDLNDAFGGVGVLTSNGVTCTIGTL